MRVTATTRIACAPERVFDTLADLRNETRWNARVSSAELRSDELIRRDVPKQFGSLKVLCER